MGRIFKNIRETLIIGSECKEFFLPDIDFLTQTGILFGGLSHTKSDYVIERTNPYYHQMIFTYQGLGQTIEDGKPKEIKPGTLFVTKAGQPQYYKIKDNTWNFLWFWVADTHEWEVIRKQNILRPAKFKDELLWVFNHLRIEHSKISFSSKMIIQCLCDLLLQYLREEIHIEMDLYQQEILEKLNALVQKIYADIKYPWDVKTLSEESGLYLSKSHFIKIFIENMGLTPMRMVTKIRMEIAANLLKNTTDNLSKIAYTIGYNTPYAFSDAFKRWFGVSPKQYRKNAE